MNSTTADKKQGHGITGNGRGHGNPLPMTPCTLPHAYMFITLNNDGTANPNRFSLLADLLYRHDVDIAFLQGVTDGDCVAVKGYHSVVNVFNLGARYCHLTQPEPTTTYHEVTTVGEGNCCVHGQFVFSECLIAV